MRYDKYMLGCVFVSHMCIYSFRLLVLYYYYYYYTPAAIDVSITSPLKSSILSEAGVVAVAAARQTEKRKHSNNDSICSELGWKCVPLCWRNWVHGEKLRASFWDKLLYDMRHKAIQQRLPH